MGLCGEFGLVLSSKWRKSFREKLEYKNLVQGEKKKIEAGRIHGAPCLKSKSCKISRIELKSKPAGV